MRHVQLPSLGRSSLTWSSCFFIVVLAAVAMPGCNRDGVRDHRSVDRFARDATLLAIGRSLIVHRSHEGRVSHRSRSQYIKVRIIATGQRAGDDRLLRYGDDWQIEGGQSAGIEHARLIVQGKGVQEASDAGSLVEAIDTVRLEIDDGVVADPFLCGVYHIDDRRAPVQHYSAGSTGDVQ